MAEDIRRRREIDPIIFGLLYLDGVKMRAIAARFGVSVQACKALRREMGLPSRPPHRTRRH